MARRVISLFLACFLMVQTTACTAPTKQIGGVEYRDYGILNSDEAKNPNIRYEPNWWNIVVAVFFFEMIIPPIYVFGFHLMKPVGPRTGVPGQEI